MAISPDIFRPVNELIVEDVKEELRLQGHKATGELEQSFRIDELAIGADIVLEAIALGYIEELEFGVPFNRINVSPAEFGRLVKWVMLRGLAENTNKARQIAYYIIQKWKTEGKPLSTSKKFSETGEILKAVEIALDKNKAGYDALISVILIDEFDNDITSQIKSGTV